jgi:hypothetical protein
MPPFRPVNGSLVADTSAPISEWVREGTLATRAACEAELRDEAARVEATRISTGAFGDARLTASLQRAVVEAVRQARCIAASN